jgi:DNA-binding transcriptional ArsR family regulator
LDVGNAVAALAVLGHGLRLDVWRTLAAHGPLGLSAGAISAHMGIAPSLLSFHLREMTQVGLLVEHRSTRQVIYAVNKEVMDALCAFLATGGG